MKTVSAVQLKAMLQDDSEIALLDVREAGQFGKSHLLFAVPLPYSRLELDVEEQEVIDLKFRLAEAQRDDNVNVVVVTHILYRAFSGRDYDKRLVVPLVLLSIPAAVGIHTVTAFLYNGLAARPYWNASILAPQFLASAFSSGPAILLIVLQLLRRFTRFEIQDSAIAKVAELMAYAMFLNLFLHGAEAFKEYYSATEHLRFTQYWFQGLDGHRTMVPYAWTAVGLNLLAFLLFEHFSRRGD